jgi:hypothetical protein
MWGREQGVITEQTGAIICTFERANAFINRKLEDEELNMLSCIIVDELHMVHPMAQYRPLVLQSQVPSGKVLKPQHFSIMF